ncbi:NAD(P)/FAD-dependent oxidoreductase [Amycolatopsis taiwanensis]|uniref:Oxidoreductase n=1 Tax=Amycolatopsis taiwanensis TaxID=342230 RepID=A0A9W6VIK7_9PSEU|nr:FAD-dependent oxidoreductase [Amycolatopsis taiwanensis]GLY67581.1 oxidoreductase [Amycolatopsis taiwanensis]
MTHDVVVLGGGYAGLPAAKRLARQVRHDEVSVTLVTAFPDFVERPRLHQMATGQQVEIVRIADYLERTPVRLVIGSATRIDLAGRTVTVTGSSGSRVVSFDTLVYALGSNVDVASVAGVAENACSLVGTEVAAEVSSGLRAVAERAGRVAVCGGGLTGIEIAAEVAEFFPALDVTLVSRDAPGGWLSDKAQTYLARTFDHLGVAVRTGSRVREVQSGHLTLDDGDRIPFDICLWAGGFRVPTLARDSGLAVNGEDRVLVDKTLESVSHPGIYAIGDAAAVPGPWGCELAMGCRTGGFTGPKVADILAARLAGRAPEPFRYRYIHECISLGRKHGLIQFLNADESPKQRILTGRRAIAYKNMTLNGAKILFRHTGPALARRRHLTTPVPERSVETVRSPAE